MTEFMRSTDAFTWEVESDPALRSTIVALALLNRCPIGRMWVNRFDRVSRRLPIFVSGWWSRRRRHHRGGRTIPISTWRITCGG